MVSLGNVRVQLQEREKNSPEMTKLEGEKGGMHSRLVVHNNRFGFLPANTSPIAQTYTL